MGQENGVKIGTPVFDGTVNESELECTQGPESNSLDPLVASFAGY